MSERKRERVRERERERDCVSVFVKLMEMSKKYLIIVSSITISVKKKEGTYLNLA